MKVFVVALPPRLSLAVTVTVFEPAAAAVGVPVIRPVEAFRVRPPGRPDEVQLYVPVPPDAAICSAVIAVPALLVWAPGVVIESCG